MNRRDFLHPRQIAHSAGHLLGAVQELSPSPPVREVFADEPALIRLGWRAMATTFEILLPYDTPAAVEAGQDAFDLIDELEGQLSVYRDTSEVCRLNRDAADRTVSVEEGLFRLLERAAQLTRDTDGGFDVTSHALIKAWGFFRGPRRVPLAAEIKEALTRVGMRHVVLRAEERSARFLRPGVEINLGGIGKGYALDRVAECLRAGWNLPAVLLHGGRSSVYAVGSAPGEPRGWPVGLTHPWDASRRLGTVWLKDRALGTSAATFRHLEYNGRKLGHVLDPRTGWPASGIASMSVVAPTGAEADALSTAFYVRGVEVARRYCQAHPEVGAVLLPDDADAPVILNLSPDEFSPSP